MHYDSGTFTKVRTSKSNKIKYKDIDELEDKQAAKEERKQAGEDSGDKETKKDEKEKA